MEQQLVAHGLPALFVLSFLAATFVPLGSEWLLVALIIEGGTNPPAAVAVASVGNYLGACLMYAIGFWGLQFMAEKLVRINKEKQEKAMRLFNQYGSWSLLFSWLPVLGDPLCLISGAARFRFLPFSLLVFLGKFLRYAFVAGTAAAFAG